jgi:hypothetical protein
MDLTNLAIRQALVRGIAAGIPIGARARHASFNRDMIHTGANSEGQDSEARIVGGFHERPPADETNQSSGLDKRISKGS